MVKILINNTEIGQSNTISYAEIVRVITENMSLKFDEFYLVHNGKILSPSQIYTLDFNSQIHCHLRVCGGKGGFGSMLRAIGAQIEKTTNREACRDLSGRRLRDINEEKRLKAWLDKQSEREREAEERKKQKIQKLLAAPKHEFKDEKYEEARSKLAEKVNDAVEEGLKKAEIAELADKNGKTNNLKRKHGESSKNTIKKKRNTLWIGDDISDGDTSSSDSSDDEANKTKIKRLN